MAKPLRTPILALLSGLVVLSAPRARADGYTRLVPLPPPAIVDAAPSSPGRNPVEYLIDGNPGTEYASDGKGIHTFVEFDFGKPTAIAGFRHQDRQRFPIAASELTFFDESGRVVRHLDITHPDQGGSVTFATITPAITARRVRWQVTKLGSGGASVGGAEITFYRPGPSEPVPIGLDLSAVTVPVSTRAPAGVTQPLDLTIVSPYAEPIDATVALTGLPPVHARLVAGPQTEEFEIPVSAEARSVPAAVSDASGRTLASRDIAVPALRKITLYILPHSHVDIGYTQLQSEIEAKQVNNLLEGMAAARRTAGYPEGARFVWNLEGLWPADLLLRRLDAAQRDAFLSAVRDGQVALDGMYFNELTGLCRPEELLDLFRFATQLRARTGVPLDAAMISDVPGYTWGTVTALSQAGIRYFSAAPNYFDRIGTIMAAWENKPFWWVGPSGRERVLVWIPSGGYALSHILRHLSPRWLLSYADELARTGYPYDVAYVRWSGLGDNAVPDPSICDFVREWNASHDWPHLVIGSVHDAFHALESRYGAELPVMKGDWTPYWEDGAGSSARETAMNGASADRLSQADALWAVRDPGSYPADDFGGAMRRVLLYDEHTWGASMSVTAPNAPEALDEWSVKSGFAATAAIQSRDLLSRAESLAAAGQAVPSVVDVLNTASWTRSGLVVLPKDLAVAGSGDAVTDESGTPVPSQRLSNGQLAIFARQVPPYSSVRFQIAEGQPTAGGGVTIHGTTLDNGILTVTVDPKTGGIAELRARGLPGNLVDTASGRYLNEYLYFNGADAASATSNGPAEIAVKEKGPLVASLVVQSAAPGCYGLTREVSLVAGEDSVELTDLVDKERVNGRSFASYRATEAKESVNFAFPFHVPGGQVRLAVPFGVIRPDDDQIPGSCKNWFPIDRWADVSNAACGVTWVSLDAPLVEVGGLTANLLNSQTNPEIWRKHVGPTQSLYAWVMNNHWGTNYRAYQEGPVTFRFLVRPHETYDAADAARLAVGAGQPLLVSRAYGPPPSSEPRLTVDSPDVIVTGLKPSDDRRAIIVRLWGAGGRDAQVHLRWSSPEPRSVWLTDTGEAPLKEAGSTVDVPAWGVVALRADLR